MHEVQDRLLCPVNFVTNIVSCATLHFAYNVEHFGDGKLTFCKYSPSEIMKDTVAVLTLIALRTLPCCSLLDRVRTARVRTRHFVRPPVIAQILHTVLFVRQKDLVDAFSANHAVADYELQS